MLRGPSARTCATWTARLALLLASVLAIGVGQARAADPAQTLGVYTGARDVDGVEYFESWLGRELEDSVTFLPGDTWAQISSHEWTLRGWQGTGYRIDWHVPILPKSGGTLKAGAAGDYNSHFVTLAQNLVRFGEGNAILRLGGEFNGSWARWCPCNFVNGSTSLNQAAADYAAYWRQIVTAMRSVPGQSFEFEWNPNLSKGAVAPDRAYPGDDYVDRIGVDIYDQSWIAERHDPAKRWDNYLNMPYGLEWHRQFAAEHGKPMTYPEWGLMIRPDGYGGGDNAYFIERMHEWIAANDVANHYYFERDAPDGQHTLTGDAFPQGAAAFRRLFGPAAEESPAEDPPGDEPPADDPPEEEPPAEDPPAEEPPADDPPAEDPPAEEPPADDPPAEDPPAEEPPADDPPAEDPPAEEPPADDPPAEDPPPRTLPRRNPALTTRPPRSRGPRTPPAESIPGERPQGSPEGGEASPTETVIRGTPRRKGRGGFRGRVRAGRGGTVTIRLERRRAGRWVGHGAGEARVRRSGAFRRSVRKVADGGLAKGRYRVRASYAGSVAAGPSDSRYRRFRIGA